MFEYLHQRARISSPSLSASEGPPAGAQARPLPDRAQSFSCVHRSRAIDSWIMTDVTQVLKAIAQGDPSAAEQLLPLVYDELRRLAAHRLAHEKPGQTLDATALVHE